MEIHKLSSNDYFIYTTDSSVNIDTINANENYLYINGQLSSTIAGGYTKRIVPFYNSIHIYYDSPNDDHDYTGSISISNGSEYKDINFFAGKEAEINASMKYQKNIDDMSYQLLRVNPKLTGNIKVVVDSDSNLYLDTFKVSEGLSQEKYRKIKINPDEYYGRTLMAKLKGIPSTDLYKIEDGCYEMFSTCSTLEEQYYDKYNCGVRTNNDKLYNENFSMLAPLKIKKILPDFFLVFKVKGNIPKFPDSPVGGYDINSSDRQRMEYFLKNSEIVKVFDMRDGTHLGKYIRGIYNHAKDFIGDMYVAYDYDAYNIYNGISLERGIVSKIYESASQERNLKNQVAMNDWYTLGFERNRIVAKDIVNFEFMFDDTSEKLFSLNTYFGLYVKVNTEENDFSVIQMTGPSVFDTPIKLNKNFDPSSESNKSIIYGLTTPYTFTRLNENISGPDTSALMEPYLLKPYKCLDVANTGNNYSNDYYGDKTHAFASFILKKPLLPGEMFRIKIDLDAAGTRELFQVICSNRIDTNDISDVIEETISINNVEYKCKTLSIYNISYTYDDENAAIERQIKVLRDAFEKILVSSLFKSKTNILFQNSLSIEVFIDGTSISGSVGRLVIQKIMSNCSFNEGSINISTDDRISFFGIDNLNAINIKPSDGIYYPIGFESIGTRVLTEVDFMSRSVTSMDHDPTSKISSIKSVIYPSRDEVFPDEIKYNRLLNLYINYIDRDEVYNNITSNIIETRCILGYDPKYPYVISIEDYEFDKVYLYQNYPLNAGICSILPVKDFYTDVIDAYNRISINNSDGNINYFPGEYQDTNNTYSESLSYGQEESVCDYLDKNETFKYPFIYDELDYTSPSQFGYIQTDASIYEYFQNHINGNHTKSDISLISPYCCKWQSLGTNDIGKYSKIMYEYHARVNASRNSGLYNQYVSYFIPVKGIYGYTDDDESYNAFTANIGYVANESNYLPLQSRFDINTDVDSNIFAWEIFGEGTLIKSDDHVTVGLFSGNYENETPVNGIRLIDEYKETIFNGYIYDVSFEIKTSIKDNNTYTLVAFGKSFDINGNADWTKVNSRFVCTTSQNVGIYYLAAQNASALNVDIRNISIHNAASTYINQENDPRWLDTASNKVVNGNISFANHKGYRDYILNGPGSIDDILYSMYSNKPKFSKVSSIGDNIIEFISAGIKFRISSNHASIINMSDYTGYNAIFMCADGNSPDNASPCEIIIDENSKEIAFVLYTGIALSHIWASINELDHKYSQIYHTSQFADTWKTSDGAENLLQIPIDASIYSGYYDPNAVYSLIQHSPIADSSAYTSEHDCYTMSKIKRDEIYYIDDSTTRAYFSTYYDTAKVYVDSNNYTFETSAYPKRAEDLLKKKNINLCFFYCSDNVIPGGYEYKENKWNLDDLENLRKDCALIIKTKNGTNIYPSSDNMVNVDIIQPIHFSRYIKGSSEATSDGYTHPTFAEPITKDMFTFDFDNTSVESTGKVSCKGCNLKISDVYSLYQTWLRKYRPVDMSLQTSDTENNKLSSLSLKHNVSITASCWDQNLFRIYTTPDGYEEQNGIETGYEKNTFFGSRGLTLKTKEDASIISSITIDTWVYEIKNNTIEIDITNSVINKILNEEGFIMNWSTVTNDNNVNRKKYIQNSIINKYIDIQNAFENKRFTIWCDYNTSTLKLDTATDLSTYDIVTNIDNVLTFEDSVYKMILKNVDNHTYYISIDIPTK